MICHRTTMCRNYATFSLCNQGTACDFILLWKFRIGLMANCSGQMNLTCYRKEAMISEGSQNNSHWVCIWVYHLPLGIHGTTQGDISKDFYTGMSATNFCPLIHLFLMLLIKIRGSTKHWTSSTVQTRSDDSHEGRSIIIELIDHSDLYVMTSVNFTPMLSINIFNKVMRIGRNFSNSSHAISDYSYL